MSVCPSRWSNSDPTGRIFLKYDALNSFRKSTVKFQVSLQSDYNKGYNKDLRTFMIISRSTLLRTINILDKVCRENQKTHFMSSDFFPQNHAAYEIMWKNMVEPGRTQMIILYNARAMHAG